MEKITLEDICAATAITSSFLCPAAIEAGVEGLGIMFGLIGGIAVVTGICESGVRRKKWKRHLKLGSRHAALRAGNMNFSRTVKGPIGIGHGSSFRMEQQYQNRLPFSDKKRRSVQGNASSKGFAVLHGQLINAD